MIKIIDLRTGKASGSIEIAHQVVATTLSTLHQDQKDRLVSRYNDTTANIHRRTVRTSRFCTMESTMYRQRRRPFKPWVPLWLRWFVTWWTSAQNCNDGMFDELNTPGGSPPQSRIEFLNRPSILHHTLDSRVRPILQSQSAFNILPLEVRQQIWKDTVGGHAFHLAIHGHDRRFVGWMCGTPDPSTCRMNRYGGRCWPLPLSKAETEERRNMLALLRTCRQM